MTFICFIDIMFSTHDEYIILTNIHPSYVLLHVPTGYGYHFLSLAVSQSATY